MTSPKASFTVNVDVTNPGQFFACCGLLELAHRLWRGAEGWFEGPSFCLLRTDGRSGSGEEIITALLNCEVKSIQMADPKTAPIKVGEPFDIRLDWWLKPNGSSNPFKTWAGNATSMQMYCKWIAPLKRCLERFH